MRLSRSVIFSGHSVEAFFFADRMVRSGATPCGMGLGLAVDEMKKKETGWMAWVIISIFVFMIAALFGRTLHQAYQDIQEASPTSKTKFQPDFPGLDAAATLGTFKRGQIISMANRKFCPCGCGYTIAACLNNDSDCPMRSKNLVSIEKAIRKARSESS